MIKLFHKIPDKITNIFLEERDSWPLWIPVIFGLGILCYFSSSGFKIGLKFYLITLALFVFAIFVAIKLRAYLRSFLAIFIALFLGGFLWSYFYEWQFIKSKKIESQIYATIIGKVSAIDEYADGGQRVILSDLAIYQAKSNKNSHINKEKAKKELKKHKKKPKKKIKKKKSPKIKKPKKTKKPKKVEESDLSEANSDKIVSDENKIDEVKPEEIKPKMVKSDEIKIDDQKKDDIKAKKKAKKPKKPKKPKKKKNPNQLKNSVKITKNIEKTYFQLKGYPAIDRGLVHKPFVQNFYDRKYLNPPHKISLNVRKSKNSKPNIGLEIGDYIKINGFLQPFLKEDQLSNFNFGRHYYFQRIGATGFSTSEAVIIAKNHGSNFDKINNYRHQIADNIKQNFKNQDEAAIFIALLVGLTDGVSKDLMQDFRNSGLAHILSISGLHLSLSAAIFFIFWRFILTRFEGLTLRFNIKKIAAILAIFASFAYLIIAGAPIPAIRSFLMVLLIFLSILFNQKSNSLRSLALGALIILILNPASIFSISFQMSFAAILALIAFYEATKKYQKEQENRNFLFKFAYYFLGIIASSMIAQIVLTPFVAYYFNSFSLLGILANMVAIPLTTFIVMPLAFVYLFLVNIGLEKIAIYPLHFALENIVNIAHQVANLRYASFKVSVISSLSFILMISGFLWLCLWQKNWRYLGLIAIFIGIFLAYKTPLPNLIIDGNRQFFAIYDAKKGSEKELFLSKKVRDSARIRNLMQKLAVNNYKTIDQLEDKSAACLENRCYATVSGRKILFLTGRNKIDEICKGIASEKYNMLVNLSKFELPDCYLNHDLEIINNRDLENGSKYFYF